MKVKVTKTLRTEQKTLHILLAVGIVAFLLSMLLELAVSPFICVSLYETLHLNYFINILLGISCSAVISFIGLIFPYLNKKNGQIEAILSELNEIYDRYLIIYGSISNMSTNGNLLETDDYSIEKTLYNHVDELIKKIYTVITNYENSNFTSKDIDEINKVFRKSIIINLSTVKEFCSFFLLYENITKQDKSDTDLNPRVLKDVITKRAEKDYYKFLLEKIEAYFPLNEFAHVYKNISNLADLKNYATNQIEQVAKECDEILDIQNQIAIGFEIRSKISEIRTNHRDAYNNECQKLRERVQNILVQMKEKGDNNSKSLISFLDEINDAIRNDELQKATQLINELENKIIIEK